MNNSTFKDHPFIKYSKDISEICQPFFKSTEVTYFTHVRVFKSGKYFGFSTAAKWSEHYLKKNYHEYDICYRSIPNKTEKYMLWSVTNFNEKIVPVYKDVYDHNYGKGITIMQNTENSTHYYCFGASSNNQKMDSFFINHMDTLKIFILYFLDKLSCNKKLPSFSDLENYIEFVKDRKNYNIDYIESKNVRNFHKDLNIKKYYLGEEFSNKFFSKKEIACIKLMLLRKSSKQIGKSLDLSFRTIESYIEKLKFKTKCETLSELHEKLIKNRFIYSILKE